MVRNGIGMIFFGMLLLTGCSSTGIKHVSSDEFIRKANMIEEVHSASSTTYIGSTSTRAYVEQVNQLPKPFKQTMVYWTELDRLPADLQESLKRDNPPWNPWQKAPKRKNLTVLEGEQH